MLTILCWPNADHITSNFWKASTNFTWSILEYLDTNETARTFEYYDYVIIYSLKKDDIHKHSVAVVRPKEMSNYYQRYDLINQRVIMMTQLKAKKDILLACQRCALVSSYSNDEKEEFYVTNSKSLIIFLKKQTGSNGRL